MEVEAEILSSLAGHWERSSSPRLGWAVQWCEAAASSVVSRPGLPPVTLPGRMTTPGLVSCSSFPALLVLLTGLLVSLLSVPPTEACKLCNKLKHHHYSIPLAGWDNAQQNFMNLKFNRSLFRDVSRECSLEGKFEAVINRRNPAYLLKLDGKDKTVFSQQVSSAQTELIS